jgi:hypothetical protein
MIPGDFRRLRPPVLILAVEGAHQMGHLAAATLAVRIPSSGCRLNLPASSLRSGRIF